jgi:WD40 repeat protein
MIEEKDTRADLPTSIVAADFSPDGKILITASLGGTLAEWDAETGLRRRVLLDPKGIEDENPRVYVMEDGQEVEAPFQLRRLSESMRGSSLLSVRFSPDGRYFAVGAANGTVVVWNACSRGELFGWRPHESDVVTLDISPDRQWLATGALDEGIDNFKVWRLEEHPVEVREVFSDHRHVGGVWTVCFSPDGRLVAAGGWTMSGYTAPLLYEVKTGKRIGGFYWDMTRAMRFSPDSQRLITGDESGNVKVWTIGKEKPLYELEAHKGLVSLVGLSADGTKICSGGDGGGVKVWEAMEGELLREHPVEGRVLACRFADEGGGLHVASASRGADHPEIQRLD